ncbi:helix-turn-helix domain-containing protein [Nostoc sp. XA013]|nr:helix-turn-helix domain-containing protein [Nostoc sp. XA013]
MAGITRIEIKESAEELEALLRQQRNARIKERVQALYMIKAQGTSVCAIAKILGKHRSTVQRWLAEYRETGIETMLEFGVSPGRTRVIPNWAVESLKKQLEQPEIGFAGYKQIQHWLGTIALIRQQQFISTQLFISWGYYDSDKMTDRFLSLMLV